MCTKYKTLTIVVRKSFGPQYFLNMNYFSIKFYIIFIFQTKNLTTMNSSEDIKLIPRKIVLQRWHMWFGNAYRPIVKEIVKESRLNDALYHFI